ncbi:hypothetical protein [Bacillus phage SPO1L1]|nr:hypothetical protein [Bacillus phage SPO1L1]WIT26178.1 hypothetical protein [Bacillus phage SPO1L2]
MIDLNIESEIVRQIEEYKDWRGKLPENIVISEKALDWYKIQNPFVFRESAGFKHPACKTSHTFMGIPITVLDSKEITIVVG